MWSVHVQKIQCHDVLRSSSETSYSTAVRHVCPHAAENLFKRRQMQLPPGQRFADTQNGDMRNLRTKTVGSNYILQSVTDGTLSRDDLPSRCHQMESFSGIVLDSLIGVSCSSALRIEHGCNTRDTCNSRTNGIFARNAIAASSCVQCSSPSQDPVATVPYRAAPQVSSTLVLASYVHAKLWRLKCAWGPFWGTGDGGKLCVTFLDTQCKVDFQLNATPYRPGHLREELASAPHASKKERSGGQKVHSPYPHHRGYSLALARQQHHQCCVHIVMLHVYILTASGLTRRLQQGQRHRPC